MLWLPPEGLITAFDIDSAVGVQLDILGLWIYRSCRVVSQPSQVSISAGIPRLGYDQGMAGTIRS